METREASSRADGAGGAGSNQTPPSPGKGFLVETADDGAGALRCRDVRGFREALLAAAYPAAPIPRRLVLVLSDAPAAGWLAAWSTDVERTRRTVTVRRLADGKRVTAVTTIASYGYGVDPSLGVESIVTRRGSRIAEPTPRVARCDAEDAHSATKPHSHGALHLALPLPEAPRTARPDAPPGARNGWRLGDVLPEKRV